MNAFIDSMPFAIGATVAGVVLATLAVVNTQGRRRFREVRRKAQHRAAQEGRSEVDRADRVALVGRQATPFLVLTLVLMFWGPKSTLVEWLAVVCFLGVCLYWYLRPRVDAPPRVLMPQWFRDDPAEW